MASPSRSLLLVLAAIPSVSFAVQVSLARTGAASEVEGASTLPNRLSSASFGSATNASGTGRRPGMLLQVRHLRRFESNDSEAFELEADPSFFDERRVLPDFVTNTSRANKTNFELVGVRLNVDGDSRALLSVVILSGLATIAMLAIFVVLRSVFPQVYSREGLNANDPASRGCTYWFTRAFSVTAEEAIEAAGLDAWMMLEFYSLNRRLFGYICPALVLVLCPMHYRAGFQGRDALSQLEIGNLPEGSHLLWSHALFVWLVVIVSLWLIRNAQLDFLQRRFAWISARPQPQATTLLVENIPRQYRSDKALKKYFSDLFSEDAVSRAYVVRKTGALRSKVERLEHVDYMLSLAEMSWVRAGKPVVGNQLVDVYVQMRMQCAAEAEAERVKLEQAIADEDPEVCSAAGFVTFSSLLWRRLASKEQYRADMTEFVVSMPPDPSDVIYSDLGADPIEATTSEFCGGLCILMVFVFWSPFVVLISSFTNLNSVQQHFPIIANLIGKIAEFGAMSTERPRLEAFFDGVLSGATLKLLLAFLPLFLLQIIQRVFKLRASVWGQIKMQRWYFYFLLTFVLLVTTLGRSLVMTVSGIVERPTKIFSLLAASLPGASHFYINYITLSWCTTAFELLRISNLGQYLFYRFFSQEEKKAKQFSEPESQAGSGMGARMAFAVLTSTITLVFCTVSPLIGLSAWMFFALGRGVYGYLLVFTETKKSDLGGLFWVEALRQVFVGLLLYVSLMIGILSKQAQSVGPPLVAVCALYPLHHGWRRFNQVTWDTLPLDLVVANSKAMEPAAPRVGQYVQPECARDNGMRKAA